MTLRRLVVAVAVLTLIAVVPGHARAEGAPFAGANEGYVRGDGWTQGSADPSGAVTLSAYAVNEGVRPLEPISYAADFAYLGKTFSVDPGEYEITVDWTRVRAAVRAEGAGVARVTHGFILGCTGGCDLDPDPQNDWIVSTPDPSAETLRSRFDGPLHYSFVIRMGTAGVMNIVPQLELSVAGGRWAPLVASPLDGNSITVAYGSGSGEVEAQLGDISITEL